MLLLLVNDLAAAVAFPRYGPKAVALGLGAQAAVQLFHERERAGVDLYAVRPQAFDRSTMQMADLFANQGRALLGCAQQVMQRSEALHSRSDIGTAVGIVMERYGIDQHQAFAFLAPTPHTATSNSGPRPKRSSALRSRPEGTTAGAATLRRIGDKIIWVGRQKASQAPGGASDDPMKAKAIGSGLSRGRSSDDRVNGASHCGPVDAVSGREEARV